MIDRQRMMIPYYRIPEIHLIGTLSIHPFSILVAVGVLVGGHLIYRRAEEAGIERKEMRNAVVWATVAGFIGSHIVEILFYHPELLSQEGAIVLARFWKGMSSFGGFLGALIGLSVYFGRLKKPWLLQADIILQGLVVGWIFGRLGCTIAHDHIGRESTFFLAFNYPGGSRHNPGFYEFLLTLFVLFPAILILHKWKARQGAYLAVVSIIYAPARFGLDFLRIANVPGADLRYWGLTAAQYGSIALFCFGVWMSFKIWNPGEKIGLNQREAGLFRAERG